jgi:hypothetical protein
VSTPLFVAVRVTGPAAVGVTVKVCGVAEVNVSTIGVVSPPPEGVMVMLPLKTAFGVTVKTVEAVLNTPPAGPVKV